MKLLFVGFDLDGLAQILQVQGGLSELELAHWLFFCNVPSEIASGISLRTLRDSYKLFE